MTKSLDLAMPSVREEEERVLEREAVTEDVTTFIMLVAVRGVWSTYCPCMRWLKRKIMRSVQLRCVRESV
jgi:hypothetical protein